MTNKAFEVWNCGSFTEISIGDVVTVFRCGSGHSVFGEPGKLARATKQHLIFVTESGAEVKTPIDNISFTVGKAKAEGYCVSLKAFDSFDQMIKSSVLISRNALSHLCGADETLSNISKSLVVSSAYESY